MTTLVTGATGFLGSHIARKLVARGEHVRILLRKNSRTTNIDDIDAERVYGDILDIDSVKAALENCDTVFHVAGKVSPKKRDYKNMEDININGTINVLSAALEQGVNRVIYTSSIATIGVDPSGGIVNENHAFNLEHLGIKYLNSKYHAEMEAVRICEKGLPLVIVNPSIVFGPGDIYLTSTGFIPQYCKRKLPGYLDSGFNVVDVEDVAEGHILAAERGRIGERYILGNKNLTMENLFELMEKVSGIPRPKRKIPYHLALLIGFLSERILRLSFANFSSLDFDSVRLSRLRWYYDSSKAVEELGFPQTPIEVTLEKTIKWFSENGYI